LIRKTKHVKYPNITIGRVEAVWNKLGGEEGVEKFLRGDTAVTIPARRWREQDGVIYLSVTSNGMTGPEWITHLEKLNFRLSKWSKDVLNSPDFKPTNGVTYEIAILKGMLFEDKNRVTKKIRAEAESRKLTTPNAEVACLIRENFSDDEIEAMGLIWIVAMHEPIKDSGGGLRLLGADRFGDGRWLGTACDGPDDGWRREDGFAFVSSQVQSPQN
jgi:hypothetical protein